MSTATAKKQPSHVSKMQTEGLITEFVIKEKLNLSNLEYGGLVFDGGLKFLKSIYGSELREFRVKMETSQMFWKWWKNEWSLWNDAFMSFAFNDSITVEFYKKWMLAASESSNCNKSFALLLKIIKDVDL